MLKTYLDVQMDDVVLVHVSKSGKQLLDVLDHLSFGHGVAIVHNPVKEFSAGESERLQGIDDELVIHL